MASQCPKCGSDKTYFNSYHDNWECGEQECLCVWVEWQQKEIDEMVDIIGDFFEDDISVATAPLMLAMKTWYDRNKRPEVKDGSDQVQDRREPV